MNSIVETKGKLPLCLELRSSLTLDILSTFLEPRENESKKIFRARLRKGLYNRCRPGFYMELNEHFHLGYADQRDGHGTQHYWRIFYDDVSKEQVEALAKGSSIAVTPNKTNGAENAKFEWGGLYLRSPAEVAIAKELYEREVLFFANVRGRVGLSNSPLSAEHSNGRVELDFLVFKGGKCMILEVDGSQHTLDDARDRDYARDRLMLREGVPTVRFTARDCVNATVGVVDEFLGMF